MNWITSVFNWVVAQLKIEEVGLLVIGWLKTIVKSTDNKIDDMGVDIAEAVLLWTLKQIDTKVMLTKVVASLKMYSVSTDNKIDDKVVDLIEVILKSKELID